MRLTEKGKLAALVLSVLIFLVFYFVAYQPEETLSLAPKLVAYFSLPFLGGFVALFLGSVVSTISIRGSSMTLTMVRRVSAAPTRSFLLGFFASAYLILVRPRLAPIVSILLYCEWLAAVFAVYLVYFVTGLSLTETYDRFESLGWRKHVQEVSRETGRDFKQIAAVVEQFLNQGIKEPLLVYLALYLQRLGGAEREILDILDPLVRFQEDAKKHRMRYLIYPHARIKHAAASRKARENLVEALFDKIYRLRSE